MNGGLKDLKRKALYAVNVIVPLTAGLLIYLTRSESTYVSDIYASVFPRLPVISYPVVIKRFACDFLWAYSLFFCLKLVFEDPSKGDHDIKVITVTAIAAVILEVIQISGRIPGTFDPWDIVTEMTAIAVALLITKIIERRFNHHEEKNIA